MAKRLASTYAFEIIQTRWSRKSRQWFNKASMWYYSRMDNIVIPLRRWKRAKDAPFNRAPVYRRSCIWRHCWATIEIERESHWMVKSRKRKIIWHRPPCKCAAESLISSEWKFTKINFIHRKKKTPQIGHTRESRCIWHHCFLCSQSEVIPRSIGWRVVGWAAIRSHASKGFFFNFIFGGFQAQMCFFFLSRAKMLKAKSFTPIVKLMWRPSGRTPLIPNTLIKSKPFHVLIEEKKIKRNHCMNYDQILIYRKAFSVRGESIHLSDCSVFYTSRK